MELVDLPVDRVIALPGAEVDALAPAIARDHPALAPIVTPRAHGLATQGDFARAAVTQLEETAVRLLPAWLPAAADISRPDLNGLAALRLVTAELARHAHFPVRLLTDLAVLALTGHRPPGPGFPLRVRASALARLVATGFGRRRVVLLVDLAAATPAERAAVAAGAQWLIHHGGPAIWLLGPAPAELPAMHLRMPAPDELLAIGMPAIEMPVRGLPVSGPVAGLSVAGLSVVGRPHPASRAEAALEAALATEPWAAGRSWNQTYRSGALTAPVRLDLLWPAERCVVEIDGPEHCRPEHFEADRRRDVLLQLDGYAVLRFTNARVLHDVGAVVHQIGTFLQRRRTAEGQDHGRR